MEFNSRRTKITNIDEYQALANGFINRPQYTEDMDYLLNTALGIGGEGGEFIDIVKKIRFHGHPFTPQLRDKLIKELGDCLWYLAQGCIPLGVTLSEVAAINIRKLTDRHKGAKFSESASLNKDESKEAVNIKQEAFVRVIKAKDSSTCNGKVGTVIQVRDYGNGYKEYLVRFPNGSAVLAQEVELVETGGE